MKKGAFTSLLLNKNFLKIWMAVIFSLVSAQTINFVLIGRVFATTQSTVAVGFLLFFYFLPTMLLGPFAGVFIDNWSKRKIFIFSNLFQALIVLFYLSVGERIWPFYGIIFLYSLCDEFFNPGVGAALPAIVTKKNLPAANSLFLLTGQGSIIIGSFLGGVIFKYLNQLNFLFLAISFFLLVATFLSYLLPERLLRGIKKIKLDFSNLSDLSKVFDLPEFWKQTKEGYRFIKKEPLVLFPIILLSGLQGFLAMGLVILPSFAKMLKIGFADSSYLIIFPIILGALLGGILAGQVKKRVRKNVLILFGLYQMGIIILFVSILSLFLSQPIFVASPLVLGLGVSYVLIYVPLQTLIQEYTPFDVRGRVFGVLNMAISLASVFPMLITTTLIDIFGLRWILIAISILVFFLAGFAQRKKAMILNLNKKQE